MALPLFQRGNGCHGQEEQRLPCQAAAGRKLLLVGRVQQAARCQLVRRYLYRLYCQPILIPHHLPQQLLDVLVRDHSSGTVATWCSSCNGHAVLAVLAAATTRRLAARQLSICRHLQLGGPLSHDVHGLAGGGKGVLG